MLTGGRYRFGGFELRLGTRELLSDAGAVALGRSAFDLLVCFVENRERTVMNDELLDAVWPGVVVIDSNLNAQVSAWREVLGALAVVAVSGRGFRFGLEEQGELALVHSPQASTQDLPVMAVLPFRNLSGDPAEGYFADGIAEDILTALSSCRLGPPSRQRRCASLPRQFVADEFVADDAEASLTLF